MKHFPEIPRTLLTLTTAISCGQVQESDIDKAFGYYDFGNTICLRGKNGQHLLICVRGTDIFLVPSAPNWFQVFAKQLSENPKTFYSTHQHERLQTNANDSSDPHDHGRNP